MLEITCRGSFIYHYSILLLLQEVFDAESITGTHKSSPKCSQTYNSEAGEQPYSNESFVSTENADGSYEIPDIDCDKFREVLEHRCDKNNLNKTSSPRKSISRNNSESSVDKELAQLNKEMEGIKLECQEMVDNHIQNKLQKDNNNKTDPYKTPRNVPRMGTRLEYVKTGSQCSESPDSSSPARRESPTTPKMGQTRIGKTVEKDRDGSTSAYNTGESCRSTPLTLELNMASDGSEKGFKNSMLCLATTSVTTTPPLPSHSDTEKQTQTPARSRECSSDENYITITNNKLNITENGHKQNDNQSKGQINSGESLQDLYMQYADVMYTNRANLEHTMQVQQKLFQQQLEQKHHRRKKSGSPSHKHSSQTGNQSANDSQSPSHQPTGSTPPDSGQMEWVVKRRPDGTRYITRRPVRSKLLKERAKKISEERCGMTTDDDAMSELKTGRYWTKEERKRHMEKAKDQKRKREMIARAKMETLKESDEKKEIGIVELSHRKMMKHKGKRALDDFTTVQEMLAHGNKMPEGKTYNPLLSVTTV